jgi:hypothetical protein
MDRTLAALYGSADGPARGGSRRRAGLGGSAPQVARWLGDVRTYFPTPVVQVMQRDAIDRLGIASLLLEPEMLAAVEPDVHLVGTLLSLAKAMPDEARERAGAEQGDEGAAARAADLWSGHVASPRISWAGSQTN